MKNMKNILICARIFFVIKFPLVKYIFVDCQLKVENEIYSIKTESSRPYREM